MRRFWHWIKFWNRITDDEIYLRERGYGSWEQFFTHREIKLRCIEAASRSLPKSWDSRKFIDVARQFEAYVFGDPIFENTPENKVPHEMDFKEFTKKVIDLG